MDAKWVIIWLSFQVSALGWGITKLAYDNGYLKGRASVYAEFVAMSDDGTCFAKNGCKEDQRSGGGTPNDRSIKIPNRSKR